MQVPTILTTKVRVEPHFQNAFADWQAKLNAVIAAFPGFVSLEILSPRDPSQLDWEIIQRFYNNEQVLAWRTSREYKNLIDELRTLLKDEGESAVQESELGTHNLQGGVTEVFITEVNPNEDARFRKWIAKIHQAEAKCPGFRGVYVQSPTTGQGKNWITLLQFDTQENLDKWLSSKEREQVLKESKPLIAAIESHRMISPFAGWFSSIARKGEVSPAWKQTMLVLLVLFPIVMLELKFLSPLTSRLGTSLSMFIGNAISVSLIAWPMMPIAIWFLGWWLSPQGNKRTKTALGTCLILALYLIEIVVFL